MIPVDKKIGQERRMHFGTIGEMVRKKTAHSTLHRNQHVQFVLDGRSEVNRNQYCEQLSASGNRVWQSSALVSPTKTLTTDLAPIGGDFEPS